MTNMSIRKQEQFHLIINNNTVIDFLSELFIINSKIHIHNTRHANDCHLPDRHTKLGQFSISFQGPKIWNDITTKIRDFKSFKQIETRTVEIYDNRS